MHISSRLAVAVAVTTLGALFVSTIADAHPHRQYKKKRSWQPIAQCQGPIEGLASSTGILGMGTARAQEAARYDWETKASNAYGPSYGNLSMARNVRWDCKKNALVLAKCVIVADPCEARISG